MNLDITCSTCGTSEELTGVQEPEGIRIRCDACGATWLRDGSAICATCGGEDLTSRPKPMTQYSRGTQLSIVGWVDTLLCRSCDADMLAHAAVGKRLPSEYRSAAQHSRDSGRAEP